MRDHDEDMERIRAGASCAAVLEALQPGWTLDRRESTRRCRKYRAGPGRILIVNHEGRGWWDPLSAAKGDVFDLVRHLDPALGFGQACDVLRAFVGLGSSHLVAPPSDALAKDCGTQPDRTLDRAAACGRGLARLALPHRRARSARGRGEVLVELDRMAAEPRLLRPDYWIERFLKTGGTKQHLVDLAGKWLAARNSLEALRVAAAVIAEAGGRSDLSVFLSAAAIEPAEATNAIVAETAYRVRRRTPV